MSSNRKLSTEESKKYIGLRRNFPKPVIGVTGNLGKTSTLEMIRTILAESGKVLKNSRGYGSWKNNISTLENLGPEYDYALFEFDYQRGNHFAEILRLIKPSIGIVTNIGDAHLNYLGNMLQVALEKSAVVKYLASGGLAILNKDDELSSSLVKYISTKNICTFGLSESADYFASDIQQLGPEGIRLKINGKHRAMLPFYSIQDVYNFLAATACACSLGFTIETIVDIFQNKFQLPAGHGRLHRFGEYYFLDESYMATPQSLSKAARALTGFQPYTKNLIFIIGDMSGTGINVEEQHLNMGYFLSALPINTIITVGENAKFLAKGASLITAHDKKIFSVNSIDEVLNVLDENLSNKAVLGLKGVGSVAAHRITRFLEQCTN